MAGPCNETAILHGQKGPGSNLEQFNCASHVVNNITE